MNYGNVYPKLTPPGVFDLAVCMNNSSDPAMYCTTWHPSASVISDLPLIADCIIYIRTGVSHTEVLCIVPFQFEELNRDVLHQQVMISI